MQDYVLFTDSTTDLSPALIEEMDAVVMPMSFTLNGQSYKNYPDGREMPMADFYAALRSGGMSTTSQLTMEMLRETFTPVLEQGKDVLYLAFSSGLSGTYQTACITAQDLMEEYPGRRVVCVDTLQASMAGVCPARRRWPVRCWALSRCCTWTARASSSPWKRCGAAGPAWMRW